MAPAIARPSRSHWTRVVTAAGRQVPALARSCPPTTARPVIRGSTTDTGAPGAGTSSTWVKVHCPEPIRYVVNTHQLGNDHGPTVFTYYYPLTDADPRAARMKLLGTDRDGWAEVALSDLSMAHADIRNLTERLDVMRWGHAMIRPTPGFLWGRDRRKAAEPYRGIHFAGADLSGIPIFEEALYHGVRAAEEVVRK